MPVMITKATTWINDHGNSLGNLESFRYKKHTNLKGAW